MEYLDDFDYDELTGVVRNKDEVQMYIRNLASLNRQVEDIKEIGDAEIQRIRDWVVVNTSKKADQAEFLEKAIVEYALSERLNDVAFKLKTPYGKVSFRTIKKWDWKDETKIIHQLEMNDPESVRVKKEINKIRVKKMYGETEYGFVANIETGEVLDGVEIHEQTSATIKTDAGVKLK